jgi:NitT/TauT family transport system substrate-binding protein
LFSLIPLTSAQETLREERFLLTFIPNIQFSPLYVAQAQGYFAEAGANITLEYLNEPDVVDLVAAGQANYGMVSGEQAMLAVERQRPIVYVYNWFQQFPIGVVVSADSGITTVEDLRDKRVGVPGRFGANYTGLIALLRSAEMSDSDIQLQEIGFNAPEVFCIGQIDASMIYINNEPLQIRNRAAAGECGAVTDVSVIRVADVFNMVSNGIITNQDLADNAPAEVTAIIAAFDKGLRDVIQNPAQAYLLSADYVDTLPLDDNLKTALETLAEAQRQFLATDPDAIAIAESRAAMLATLQEQFDAEMLIQFEVLLATIPLWEAEQLGFSNLDDWEAMKNTLVAMELLEGNINLDRVYTNQFVPTIEE